MWQIIGQIFGIVISLFGFLIFIQKTRKKVLITKLTCDFLSVFQQIMVGAYTGSIINGIAIARETVFYFRETKKWAQSKIWLIIFLVAMFGGSIVTWQGYVSLLPTIGSSFAVFGFYSKQLSLVRTLNIIAQSFWLAYGCIIFNIGTILGATFSIGGAIIGLINQNKKNIKGENCCEN